jgi:hypothetical protein
MTRYQGTSFIPQRTRNGYALFRAGVKVSTGTCGDLAAARRRRHEKLRARWRLPGPLAPAVLVIAVLRTDLTCAELAEGFGISQVTCWRNIREGISVLADRGRRISRTDVAHLAVKMGWDYLIVDGVHVPTVTSERKTGGQKAFYSGKHKRHGVSVPTVCSPDGELLWASAAQPAAPGPGQRAALPPGTVHHDGQGGARAALPGARSVRRAARRVTGRIVTGPQRPHPRQPSIRRTLENRPEPGQREPT